MSRATWSKSSMEREEGWFCQKTKDKYGLKARTQHDRSLIQHRTCRHDFIQIPDRMRTAGWNFPASSGFSFKVLPLFCKTQMDFPQFSWETLLNFQHDNFFFFFFWGGMLPELALRHFPYIISSSSLKSPSTLRMTFCIMAWVTFTLSLLHIRVGFILPLRALTQVCLANGYGRWGLLTASASDEVYGLSQQGTDAFVKRAGWATAHIVGWNQTTSSCSEVLTSDPCSQSCGGGGN